MIFCVSVCLQRRPSFLAAVGLYHALTRLRDRLHHSHVGKVNDVAFYRVYFRLVRTSCESGRVSVACKRSGRHSDTAAMMRFMVLTLSRFARFPSGTLGGAVEQS